MNVMIPTLATLSEWHIILVLIIVFLLFGGKKLPELARGIGEAMKEFKKAQREIHDEKPVTPATTAEQKVDGAASKPAEPKQI